MNQDRLMQILVAPHVSEKAAYAVDSGQHVFRVATTATKLEIKRAVESLFEVDVETVRVVNVKGKAKRFGARMGKRSDWRKAYVRLKDGQSIDLMTAE